MNSAPSAALTGWPAGARDVFGHPPAFPSSSAPRCGERFLLRHAGAADLYLDQYLLLPGHVEHVWGYADQGLLRIFRRPVDVQPLSSLIYGSYRSDLFHTATGGWLATAFSARDAS